MHAASLAFFLTSPQHIRMLSLAFLMAFALRTRFAILNRRNGRILANSQKEEKNAEEEIWDTDPRYVFMT
jgi:hypothetical protein